MAISVGQGMALMCVDWYWPTTQAGDGLPVRGTRIFPAHSPLRAWDTFELQVTLANSGEVPIRAYTADEIPELGIDAVLRRVLRDERAYLTAFITGGWE